MKTVGFVFGSLLVLAFIVLCYFVFGLLAAMLFAQFGIVKPWWFFSIAWLILSSVVGLLRGGK